MNGSFGKGFGIGCFGQVIIFALMVGGLILTTQIDDGTAVVGALSFLPALAVAGFVFLVVLLVFAAVPTLRPRIGSVPGALVGWLAGGVVVIALMAAIVKIVQD